MDCSICFDELKESKHTLSCNHHFHSHCINTWINSFHWKCPLCRADIVKIELKEFKEDNISFFKDDVEYTVNKDVFFQVLNNLDTIPYQDNPIRKKYYYTISALILFSLIQYDNNAEKSINDIKKFLNL
jgi:hypothetical protein